MTTHSGQRCSLQMNLTEETKDIMFFWMHLEMYGKEETIRRDSSNYIKEGVDKDDVEKMMNEVYLVDYEGGFINGGKYQLSRPNTFIVPQGRCAEALFV